jgi:hypothetical protein
MPFGVHAKNGAAFLFGNKEIFSKINASISLNIKMEPDDETFPSTSVDILRGGLWETVDNIDIFQSPGVVLDSSSVFPFNEEYNDYSNSSVNGFLRLSLKDKGEYEQYLQQIIDYIATKIGGENVDKPEEPYSPIIRSFSVSYDAVSDAEGFKSESQEKYNNKQIRLFHIYPFGYSEQDSYLDHELSHYLFPQFVHINDGKRVYHEGEFYIGFENLGSQQSVNVLFQVLDGSADPTLTKPPEHLHWSYLDRNKWEDFDQQQISDNTGQLIRSGIITFSIPEVSTDGTMMPPGYLWVKASLENKIDAVCYLITVDAQAAKVTFNDYENSAGFLETALPAGSISKMVIPLSEVKKLSQTYASFGGRPVESKESFYTRVSERLRHKSRAITIWDYEHLILQEFPIIHKVKCLNHTISEDSDYCELSPGHVTIVTIPDLRNRNEINPFKPYTSQNILDSIKKYLHKKISCQVRLHVCNPDFEEVQMRFNLKLAAGFDDFTVYSKKLKEEIAEFLSPWAFGHGVLDFGGRVIKSVIINFIEERQYVDFITNVQMCHYNATGGIIKNDNDEINASTAKSILVSVIPSRHDISNFNKNLTAEHTECS